MENLIKIENKYKELIDSWVNKTEAAKEAVRESNLVHPCIYKDEYEEASHIFEGDYVLIFGDGIYKKVTV